VATNNGIFANPGNQSPGQAATNAITGGLTPALGQITQATPGSAVSSPVNVGFKFTGGWFLFLACGTTILLSKTQVGPIFVGILTVGLLFQLEKLLTGK
jgi:hypothetical protein